MNLPMGKLLFMAVFALVALGMVASILQALATVLALLVALVALGMVGVELHKQRWSKPQEQLPGRSLRLEVTEWGQSGETGVVADAVRIIRQRAERRG